MRTEIYFKRLVDHTATNHGSPGCKDTFRIRLKNLTCNVAGGGWGNDFGSNYGGGYGGGPMKSGGYSQRGSGGPYGGKKFSIGL